MLLFYTCIYTYYCTFVWACILDGPTSVDLNPPGPLYPVEDETISSQCHADCNPVCTYTWRDPGGSVVETTDGHLSVEEIKRNQAGDYKCEARSKGRTLTETLTVVVHYPPDISVSVSPDSVEEGQTVTVVCTADSNPSRNDFRWSNVTANSDELGGDIDSRDTESTLTILNARCQKQSQIQCGANNGVEKSPRTKVAELDVKCKDFQDTTVKSNLTI